MLPNYPESVRRKLSRNILSRVLRMKRGQNLLIETWSGTLPWAESLVLEARILGVRPSLLLEDEETYWKGVDEAPTPNLGQVGSHELASLKEADAYISLAGPLDTAREDALPESLRQRVMAIDHEWLRVAAKYGVRSVRWDLGRTSPVRARRYGVSLQRWRKELIEATLVDSEALRSDGSRLAESLLRGTELRVSHPNGTDLTLRLDHRIPVVDDGVIDEEDLRRGNVFTVVPSGVTLVSVNENHAEGTFVGNSTGTMFFQEQEIPLGAGTWTFRKGHLTSHSIRSGGGVFDRCYAKVGAGRDRPGLISIGLNPRLSRVPLLFDQERGVVALTIGRNSFYGGRTRTPHFTAYQSIRGASVEVDGERILRAGRLL